MRLAAPTIKMALSAPDVLSALAGMAAESNSRTELAGAACERFGFHDGQGRERVASCLKVLRDFERAGYLQLPPRRSENVPAWRPRRLGRAVPKACGVPTTVRAVRGLRLVCVDPSDDEGMLIWNELIIGEHPQGERRLVGRQLRYLVESEHGWLGAIGFSASALSLEDRDRWIGWDSEQRQRHRDRVVNLSRFLIRPDVHCQNLASFILGACLRRVGDDFEQRYGERPWLLESFVDLDAHTGTCFQAANWQSIGRTKGRGRNDPERLSPESVKEIYVYPLVDDFRERMGVPPNRGRYLRPREVSQGLDSRSWVKQEFGTVELGDRRLRDRLIKIVSDRVERPEASYR